MLPKHLQVRHLGPIPVRLIREQRGYSLVELLMVMIVLGVVCGALVTVFVSGTRAEVDLNNRFRAQVNAATAIEELRRDVHCASAITPTGTSSSIAITLPSQCPTTGTVRWCAIGSGLYRTTAATCDTTARNLAGYLTSTSVFTYTAASASSLAYLDVDLRVQPGRADSLYHLTERIVLRNTSRS